MNVLRFRSELVVSWVLILSLSQYAKGQQSAPVTMAKLGAYTTDQVVDNLIQMNLHRLQALHSYQGSRTYRVEYHGFGGSRNAEMAVRVNYTSPSTKEFTVVSSSGSKLIIDKVFKKLLEAEKEALDTEIQRRSALNRDNYDFESAGVEETISGPMYVLIVEPKTKDKYLYRGRIWVNAQDFAVARLVAEPAKNPSFWTKKSEIEQVYMKVNDFWLPARNHSLSSIRLGGRADLTIEYHDYEITGAGPVAHLPRSESAPSASAGGAHRPGNNR
jgi:hypothetical protein